MSSFGKKTGMWRRGPFDEFTRSEFSTFMADVFDRGEELHRYEKTYSKLLKYYEDEMPVDVQKNKGKISSEQWIMDKLQTEGFLPENTEP